MPSHREEELILYGSNTGSHVSLIYCTTCTFAIVNIILGHKLLTNSVGRMQIVQALLTDWLAVLLILHWERSADQ